MLVKGDQSLMAATVRGIKNLDVDGIDAMTDSTIFSALESGERFVASLDGM